ncbi:Fc receptor-like protein 5 [Labrus bergylta]|uniref:Fc receptor-like protein 5 n=1 Tax=Labrus bergylta TaxID=56723 RepID=UPI0033133F69
MDQTLRCVLGFFLLNLIPHGLAQGNSPRVTITSNWPETFWNETLTLRCEIEGGGDSEWTFSWSTPSTLRTSKYTTHNESIIISQATDSDNGDYWCSGRRGSPNPTNTPWSEPFKLTVTKIIPKAELRADSTSIPAGGAVTLTCDVNPPSSGWTYILYRGDHPGTQDDGKNFNGRISVSKGGVYWCRGERGEPVYDTEYSDSVTINIILSDRAVVTLQPHWTEIYSGEKITFRCEIEGGDDSEWEYEWETTSSDRSVKKNSKSFEITATSYSEGEYKCKGKHKTEVLSSTPWSTPITLTVSEQKPKPELKADVTDIPVGGYVTLTCDVSSSSGWQYYFWYRADKSSNPSSIHDVSSAGQINVSKEGLYWCRGERGNPVYYTEDSNTIQLKENTVANKAVVTLHPNWSEIYNDESITLRCEIKDGDDAEWEYEWKTSNSFKPPKKKEYSIGPAYTLHSGNYSCKGRKKSDQSPTDWSDPITLTVLYSSPQPVLTVSPLWLSPGDSVTLNCEVKHPSAGWRFYWYEAIPKLSDNSYSYQLLSGSRDGTEKYSFIVHGQTHTAGYVCRAGRGEMNTPYSEPKFVWSGDLPSSASLTVSPERVQHFTSDSVSLECKGNSTQWRVKFQRDSSLADCSLRDTMTGSTCTIDRHISRNNVYWCESGSGEFSNAVNITKQKSDIILVSPVHPVTEGSSVSLSCRLRSPDIVSNVFFYQNNKLIQNDTRKELNISAVSKSDEGFYKCQTSGRESSQSWMSVTVVAVSRLGNPSYPVILVIVGLICGVVLIILLLLLYRCRQSKDSYLVRSIQSESTNQDSSTNPAAQRHEYSPPLQDANHSQSHDVTYSLIELKNIGKKGKKPEPDSTIYSDVRLETEDPSVLYSQISCHNPGKAKKNKGKPTPAITEESVYSEVKRDQ